MPKPDQSVAAAHSAAFIVRNGPERAIFIGGLGLTILFAIALAGLALTLPS
jgi:hypothetical protein